jgi:hypothetical protein
MALFQPASNRNVSTSSLHVIAAAGRGHTHHAAHRMTIKMATSVARLAMIRTNRKISRCNVVIDDDAVEDSFAMRPLKHHEYL